MNRDQHIQDIDSDDDSNSFSDGDGDDESEGNSNSDINSEGDSDSDDVVSITVLDHQSGQGASGSQIVTPVVECDTVGMKRRRESSKCDRFVETNFEKPQDCDEYYFMNLAKMFKKLSPEKKSEVRMKIERLLFEAEFE